MDFSIVYTKTGRGARALIKKLPPNAGQILSVMGSTANAGDIFSKLKKVNERDFELAITWLLEGGFIRAIIKEAFSDSIWAPVTPNSIAVSEISFDEFNQTMEEAAAAAAIKAQVELEAKEKAAAKEALEAAQRAEAEEITATEVKTKKNAETKAKLEALAKADEEARERAEAQAKAFAEEKALVEAAAKEALEAKKRAEAEEMAAAEAKIKEEEEAKTKREALAKADEEARERAEAQAKALAEEKEALEAKEKAESEEKAATEAKAKEEAETEAKLEELARADEEARERAEAQTKALAKEKAQAETTAKAQAEFEAQEKAAAKEEAETKAKLEELARADEEARKRAEIQAKAAAEALAKAEADAIEQAALLEAKENAEAEKRAEAVIKATIKAEKKAAAKAKNQAFKENLILQIRQLAHFSAKKFQTLDTQIDVKKIKKASKQKSLLAFNRISVLFKTFLKYSFLLLVIISAAAQFINLRMLIQPIEKFASKNMQETVNIQTVHASLFPAPHLVLENVTAGNSANMHAQKVCVYPALNAAQLNTSAPYEIEMFEIEGLDLSQQDLVRPAAWLEASNKGKQLKIKQIMLKNTTLHLAGMELPALNSEIQLNTDGELNKAILANEDKSLIVNINKPNNDYQIDLKAHQWRSPLSPLVFSELNIKGVINNSTVTLSPISGTLYDGELKASMTMNLTGNWVAKGDLALIKLNLSKLSSELKIDSPVDGSLDANGNYSFNIDPSSNQIEAPMLNARFKINNGNLNTIDLVEAMRNNSANISGTTHFTVLSGNLLLSNQIYEFKNLTLQDNQLQAYGKIDIMADNKLAGDVYSKILLKSNRIKAHLMVTGTVNSLKLKK